MKLYLIYVRKRNAVIPLNTDNNIRMARWFYFRIAQKMKWINSGFLPSSFFKLMSKQKNAFTY